MGQREGFRIIWRTALGLAFTAGCAPLLAGAKITIAPGKVTLAPSARHQFTATVTGLPESADRGVIWSRDPAIGEINAETGEYRAPEHPPGCEVEYVTITAASKAQPDVTADATAALPGDPSRQDDCRQNFEASFFLGLGVDTFAGGEVRRYLNPDDAAGPAERGVGGFNFAYRLARGANSQLWVYGETVHGVRSADIDCGKAGNKEFFLCKGDLALADFKSRPDTDLLKIIRNASSLEGFAGVRYEFLTLNKGRRHTANLYFKGQLGFLKVSSAPGDAVDMHHVGFGAIATREKFQGSYLEFGIGRNDLVLNHDAKKIGAWNRKKIDGYLSTKIAGPVSFFAQMVVDSDFGPGSDSVQTYFGLEFDLARFKFWR
jgi:hypothetical protein